MGALSEAPAVEVEEPTPSEAMEVDEPEAPAVEEVVTEAPAADEPAAEEPAAVDEAVVEAAPVEDAAPVEEAVADSDNDSEVTFQTTPRISSRLDVASITALMAKNEEGELSQQEFYRVFLMTVQSGLMANQRLEELESRMTAAEDKINSVQPAAAEAPAAEEAPAVEEAAVVEAAPVEEEAHVVEEAAVEEEVAAEPVEAEAEAEAEAVVEEPPKETEAAEEPVAEVEEEKTEEVDISTLVAVAEKMRPSRKRAQASQGGRVSQSASRAKRQRRVR